MNNEEDPTTPKENLLQEGIEDIDFSDVNDLNYTEDNDCNSLSVNSKELPKIERAQSLDPFINEHFENHKEEIANEVIKKEETNDSKILQTLRTLIKTESGEDNPRKEKRDSMEQEIEEIIASSLAENEDKKEIEDNLSPKPPKYKKKKSKKKSSKNSPNRRLKRRVNNMPQNIKHEAPSTSRSEAKLKSIEKLIIGENQRHQRKSRNSSIREGFYSHSPQTDKISNILVKNCMKTHRQSKQGSQNI